MDKCVPVDIQGHDCARKTLALPLTQGVLLDSAHTDARRRTPPHTSSLHPYGSNHSPRLPPQVKFKSINLKYIQLFLSTALLFGTCTFIFSSFLVFFYLSFPFSFSVFYQSVCLLSLCPRSCLHSALIDEVVATFYSHADGSRREENH